MLFGYVCVFFSTYSQHLVLVVVEVGGVCFWLVSFAAQFQLLHEFFFTSPRAEPRARVARRRKVARRSRATNTDMERLTGPPRLRYPLEQGPPSEVAVVWLTHCDQLTRLRCLRVCQSWRTFVMNAELWRTISLGTYSIEVSRDVWRQGMQACVETCKPVWLSTRLPCGIPLLEDFQMNSLLGLASGNLQELCLVGLTGITTSAFMALRANPCLTTVTIAQCTKVDDGIAFAMPPSVRTLTLSCPNITGRVAGLLPRSLHTLSLVRSGLRKPDVLQLKPPAGCIIDVAHCIACDRPAHLPTMTRCDRCTVIGCRHAAGGPTDTVVIWSPAYGCSSATTCFCKSTLICDDCDSRERCEDCSQPFCDDCKDGMVQCTTCYNVGCPECRNSCDKCPTVNCDSCADNGNWVFTCTICDVMACAPCREGWIYCECCDNDACGKHSIRCGCAGQEGVSCCSRCASSGKALRADDGKRIATCGSADCNAIVCDGCCKACAACDAAFCAECSSDVAVACIGFQ